jgi:hypothetical protein
MGDFCKKSRNRSIFVFPCLHFGAYSFCICPLGSAQPPLFFFSNVRVCQVTPRLKAHFARNITDYLLPEYFQSLRAKNKNQFYKLNFIYATNVQNQNGHRFFLGKLQIDSNMHSLCFVTFLVRFA